MAALLRRSMVALTGFVVLASVAARQPSAQTPPPAPAPAFVQTAYVGAAA